MRRRDALALLASLTLGTRSLAQTQGRLPVVSFLGFATEQADRATLTALRRGLSEQGYVEGQTILLEARHAGGDLDLANSYIQEMVRSDALALLASLTLGTRSLAQTQGRLPVVSFLGFATEQADRATLTALRRGLSEQGYVEGQTILLEARHAGGDLDLANSYIQEMV